MARVSRPGGRIVIWDHNPRNPYWSLLMARVPQDTGEERLIGEQEVIDGLMAGGARSSSASSSSGSCPTSRRRALVRPAAAVERCSSGRRG